MDTSLFIEQTNIPKMLFYELYKAKYIVSKNKNIVGCVIFVIEIKRPWEID